ncbi:MAG: type II toxin-antitoxin system VapB family antitoxin [Bryobacteraceae bacterium]
MLAIENPVADVLARELASRTGETLEDAVVNALRERLERAEKRRKERVAERLLAIGRACAALPDHDTRSADEILGYDETGLPT